MRVFIFFVFSFLSCSHIWANTVANRHSNRGNNKNNIETFFRNDPESDTTSADRYRLYNRQQFKVLDTTFLWIYQYQTRIVDMVRVSAKSTKVINKTVTDYYFSLNGQSELFQLTLSNFKLLLLFNQHQYQSFIQDFRTTESLLSKSDKGTYLINDYFFVLQKNGLLMK